MGTPSQSGSVVAECRTNWFERSADAAVQPTPYGQQTEESQP